MARFKNEQGITSITMRKKLHDYCPLGSDWYTNELTISMTPDKVIPDYIEIENALNDLEGKELIIEDVVDAISKILMDYKPSYYFIQSVVEDARHLPVTVIKEYFK